MAEPGPSDGPPVAGGSPIGQPAQHQDEVQYEQLEAALDAVRNPVMDVKGRQAGLCHDGAIETMDIAIVVAAPKCT